MHERRAVATVLERIPLGFFVVDRSFRFTYLNHRARAMFRKARGRARKGLVGARMWDELPEMRGTWFHGFSSWVHVARVPIQVEEYWRPVGARVEAHIHPAQGGLSVFVREVESREETRRPAREEGGADGADEAGASECGCAEGSRDLAVEAPPSAGEPGEASGGPTETERVVLDALRPVAHELRSPLHAIVLSAERLLQGETGEVEGAARHLRNIVRAAQQASRITNDINVAATAFRGEPALEREAHLPDSLLGEAAELTRPLAEEKKLHLETEEAPHLPPVLADRGRVMQVFTNLVENSARHTEAGGTVVLRARAQGEDPAGAVRFSVEDTGSGIQEVPEGLASLHRPGERGARYGLGLSISKVIVEAHGGELWVARSDDSGSVLAFTLPAAPAGSGAESGSDGGVGPESG